MLVKKIDKLKKKLIEESLLIENMLDLSFKGYIENKPEKLNQVAALETLVNQLDNKIDESCMDLLALHNPECRNLRTILAIMKSNIDLERMGDLTVNIAKSYEFMLNRPYAQPVIELANLAKDTKKMLQNAMNSFIYEDIDLSRSACENDVYIDNMHDSIFKNLISNMKISIEVALHINRISKNYERIADLSTNIAQNNIYICEGSIEKHMCRLSKVQNTEVE